ncbi:hypothetical protein [Calothrix sp. CCY 0018]|uniref:hypothetical protein n=1 Tax=Calothrix sp. CCY 0018 TaxID=3103864 RepID=UPI0039C7328B
MTNFDPEGDFKDVEAWELIAESKALNSGMSAKIIAGVLIGGVGVAFGVELLGGVVAAWCLKSAWDASKNIGKRLRLVRECGCSAFVLDEDNFRIYLKQFGSQTVSEELKFVKSTGAELSPFAENYLRTSNQPLLDQEQLGELFEPKPDLETPAVIFDSPINPSTNTQVEKWEERDQSFDIKDIIRDRIPNLFIVGLGRSGKGMLLANLLRQLQQSRRERKVFLINGKDDSKEYGYFDGVVAVEKRLDCDAASASAVAAFIESALNDYDAFVAENSGGLLVVDEGTIIGAKLKTAKASNLLNDRIVGITSSGDSTGKNIWFVVQSPYAGGNGSDLTSLSQLTKIALVHKTNLGVISDWKQARIFKNFDVEEIVDLIEKSEVDRAIYYGGTTQWYSMQKLQNYSAYDRDTQTHLQDIKSAEHSNHETSIESLKQQFKLSEEAQKILYWLINKNSKDWLYYKNYKDNKRDISFNVMLSRLGLLTDEHKLNDVFTELLELEKIDISDDDLGIRLL